MPARLQHRWGIEEAKLWNTWGMLIRCRCRRSFGEAHSIHIFHVGRIPHVGAGSG
jgi:hypothetical protein